MKDITKANKYIPFDNPIKFDGFEAIGYFPYESARIRGYKVPRSVYSIFEREVIKDNKVVVIFNDTTRFGTHDFAIFFHDLGAIIGQYEDITDYDGNELTYKL